MLFGCWGQEVGGRHSVISPSFCYHRSPEQALRLTSVPESWQCAFTAVDPASGGEASTRRFLAQETELPVPISCTLRCQAATASGEAAGWFEQREVEQAMRLGSGLVLWSVTLR